MNNILIFGGFGFISHNLIPKLTENFIKNSKINITYFSNSKFKLKNTESEKIDKFKCDITDFNDVEKIIKKVRPDLILHMPSSRYLENQNIEEHDKINIIGLENVLNSLRKIDNKAKVILFNSYAASFNGNFSKNINLNSYIYSKKKSSEVFFRYIQNNLISGNELRLSTTYGPWDYYERLIMNVILKINNKNDISLDSPSSKRDFIYVDDVVDAIIKTINKPDLNGELLEIGTGKLNSVLDIVKKIHEFMGLNYKGFNEINSNKTIFEINNKNAIEKLSWAPFTPINNGLKNTIKWALENKNYYE
tara:strand:- start:8 stop:925 length:918 start_codon:yes stop_codon:yes gene_type:complete